MFAISASHSRAADSVKVLKTVCRSKVERVHLRRMAIAGHPPENFAIALKQPGMIGATQPRH
jgi:hypothetical protein